MRYLISLYAAQARDSTAALPSRPLRKRKEKVLRSQAILDAAHQARPVVKPVLGKRHQQRQAAASVQAHPSIASKKTSSKPAKVYDIWDTEAGNQVNQEDFDSVAAAIAAKQTTPFGPIRPAKRRCVQKGLNLCSWRPQTCFTLLGVHGSVSSPPVFTVVQESGANTTDKARGD